jgi:toxin secretion/phage lysis holin
MEVEQIEECFLCIINSLDFELFISFIVFDIVLGTLLSFKMNKVSSKINKNGLTKHFTIILFVMFFSMVFGLINETGYSKIMMYFYIASYSLSIFENLSLIGVPFPEWLKNKFQLLKDNSDKGVLKNESKRIKN